MAKLTALKKTVLDSEVVSKITSFERSILRSKFAAKITALEETVLNSKAAQKLIAFEKTILPDHPKRRQIILSALSALGLSVVGGFSGLLLEIHNERLWVEAAGPNPEMKTVIIPRTSMRSLTIILQKNNVISSGLIARERFLINAWLTSGDGPARAGELTFPDHASPEQVLLTLRHGSLKKHSLTIPEGFTARKITNLLNREPLLSGEFPEIEEGTVFPSTYSFLARERRKSVLDRAKREMSGKLKHIWEGRDKTALGKLVDTPAELLTLASLVEREAVSPNERRLIAGVFLRRLKKGMRLQTDPSVLYALSLRGRYDNTLSHNDMTIDSPYNTYIYAGLPPGPICSPGEGALYAAAHPIDRGYLYFVANQKRGRHEFSRSYVEHQARVHRIFHHK